MKNTINVANRLFWVSIKVYKDIYPYSHQLIHHYYWKGPWHVRTKWSWYFTYRAALFQVQNPRSLVEFKWDSIEPDTRTRIDFLKQDISTKKRMITKISNELARYKKKMTETSIFGVEKDDKAVIKAEEKIEKYKNELTELVSELDQLTHGQTK